MCWWQYQSPSSAAGLAALPGLVGEGSRARKRLQGIPLEDLPAQGMRPVEGDEEEGEGAEGRAERGRRRGVEGEGGRG